MLVSAALREPSTIPIDLTGILPEVMENLNTSQIEQLTVVYGNRRMSFGELFVVGVSNPPSTGNSRLNDFKFGDTIKKLGLNLHLYLSGDCSNIHNIGASMSAGFVCCDGNAGRHAGSGMTGGVLSIWLVPHMSAAWGWIATLAFWSGACVVAALLWLTVTVDDAPTAADA